MAKASRQYPWHAGIIVEAGLFATTMSFYAPDKQMDKKRRTKIREAVSSLIFVLCFFSIGAPRAIKKNTVELIRATCPAP